MSHWASTWAYEQDIQPCGRKFVLVALAGFADEDGFCYPSQQTLAKMTGQDLRTVQRHLKTLEKDGVIQRKARWKKAGGRNSDGYTLQAPASKLRPKATECQVSKAAPCPEGKLPPDLSDHKVDPSVKKDPPLPPKGSYKKPVKPPPEPEPEIFPPYDGSEFTRALTDFECHLQEMKKPLKPTRRKALYDKLAVWPEEKATQALVDATANGYLGVFAPKEQNGNGNGQRRETASERNVRNIRESLEYADTGKLPARGHPTDNQSKALLPAAKSERGRNGDSD